MYKNKCAKAHFMKPNLTFEMIQEIVQKMSYVNVVLVSAENLGCGRSLNESRHLIQLQFLYLFARNENNRYIFST